MSCADLILISIDILKKMCQRAVLMKDQITWALITLFLCIQVIVCLFCCADATPTESEQEVYNVVSSVLDEAPRILKELQDYRGANEEIRQVNNYI